MNKSLIAPDPTLSYFDDSNTALMAAWPFGDQHSFLVDLQELSVTQAFGRRLSPDLSDDEGESTSPVPVTKKKKSGSSETDERGTLKKPPPPDESDTLPPASIRKKLPSDKPPEKKPRDDSIKIKKNLPPEGPATTVSTSETDKGSDQSPPPAPPIPTNEKPDKVPELSNSGSFEIPPEPPHIGTGGLPPDLEPELPDELISEKEFALKLNPDSPIADFEPPEYDILTGEFARDVMSEQVSTDGPTNVFSSISKYFADLLGYSFVGKAVEEADVPVYVPVVFPPPRNPSVETNPIESFRAGYISQNDIEDALGRENWTMCCAATFVYAVQSKYPGLERNDILEAAEKAADTLLADESGKCVDGDGYIPSLWQYSQALSKNLDLKDYVDISGQYPTVESAKAAGAGMMKVELSGTAGYEQQEHHILTINNYEIDPAPGNGINDLWDFGSKQVVNVMAMDWYPLP